LGSGAGKTCVFSPPGSSFTWDGRGNNIVYAYSSCDRGISEDSVTYKLLDPHGARRGQGGNPTQRAGRAT
jgi:hypothetical protein